MDITPTRSTYLDMLEERSSMQEGYRFLDEKRLILAAEIMQQLQQYETLNVEYQQLLKTAAGSLKGAVLRHGLNGLSDYPAASGGWSDPRQSFRSVIGLQVQQLQIEALEETHSQHPFNASPEAEQARRLFKKLITLSAQLAVLSANLLRLEDEYEHTSRRARALEDVLLPEIDQSLSKIDSALEEMDKEDIVRMHFSHSKPY
jgi:V/A-type H+-transporting ATPase subunit D